MEEYDESIETYCYVKYSNVDFERRKIQEVKLWSLGRKMRDL